MASSPRISDPQATRWAVAEAKARGWIGQAPLPDHRVDGLRFELVQRRPVGARGIAAVVVTDGIATTEVLQLAAGPRGSLTLGPIWRALRGPWLVVAVDQGRRRSLHVVDLGQVRGRLYNRRGLARFADGDLTDAATLWEQAIAADPGLMDPVYNLACLHTQQGDLERAETELRWALAMSRTRALRLARGDPDLARLRTVPSVGSLLGIVPPDRD